MKNFLFYLCCFICLTFSSFSLAQTILSFSMNEADDLSIFQQWNLSDLYPDPIGMKIVQCLKVVVAPANNGERADGLGLGFPVHMSKEIITEDGLGLGFPVHMSKEIITEDGLGLGFSVHKNGFASPLLRSENGFGWAFLVFPTENHDKFIKLAFPVYDDQDQVNWLPEAVDVCQF